MALLSSSPPLPPPLPLPFPTLCSLTSPNTHHHHFPLFHQSLSRRLRLGVASPSSSSQLCPPLIDKSSLVVAETSSEDQLWAAACLRVRSFYQFNPSTFGLQDHKRYLAEREFEALKERVAGKRTGFKKVSCINATLPLSHLSSLLIPADDDEDAGFDLCTQCKFSDVGGEDRVVVGTLDLNQCLSLPDEITGSKPEGIGADFARAYLSNVCVAKELHKNGLGYEVVGKAKVVAQGWGISDLYVHVAIDNEPAKRLYTKSGFVYEKDEPAWQARFLDRPRRLLLWIGLSSTLGL